MANDVLLLDAGVWIATVDEKDRFESAARELVLGSAVSFAAVDLTFYEIANVVGSTWRKPDRARRLCRSVQDRCASALVQIDLNLIEATIDTAARHGLTSYDAAYVAVARRHGWQLVSTDLKDLVSKGLAVTPDAAV